MSAGNPQSETELASEKTRKPEDTVSSKNTGTHNDDLETNWFGRFIEKLQSIMPIWAWVVAMGVIMAILLSLLAVGMMKNMDVSKDSHGGNAAVTPSRPAATTTGKWDSEPDIGGGDGSYDPNQEQYYAPAETAAPETSAAESSSAKPSAKPDNKRPSNSPRPNSPAPSAPAEPGNPAQPAPSTNPSPSPDPGNGNGTTPGNGNGGEGTGNTAGNGNTGNGGGNALEDAPKPGRN